MGKDYYEILGVEKGADQEEIKRAFRKKAHQLHPDKPTGDEAKFKEVNEAYQVLGNEEKRKQYDQFGSTFDQQGGFGQGMNWDDFMKYARGQQYTNQGFGVDMGDLGDIFSEILGGFGFGTSRSRRRAGVQHGRDIQMDVSIDFKEAAFGTTRELEMYKNVVCPACHGNKAEPGTPIKECKECGGQGVVERQQQTILGIMRTQSVCPACHGQAKIPETKCKKCEGEGVVRENVKIKVNIPAGIDNGQAIRLSGEGEAGQGGGEAGDLYVTVHVEKQDQFQRQGDDIVSQKEISFPEAALGCKVDIETIDGTVELKVPSGTQSGKVFKLRHKGVTHLGSSSRGDHLVEIIVKTPTHLSRQQKKILKEFND